MRRTLWLSAATLLIALGCSTRVDDEVGTPTSTSEAEIEGRVVLSESAVEAASLEIIAVDFSEATVVHSPLSLPAHVAFDSTRLAVASPRAAGRLERLAAGPGERVREGQAMAWVSSPEFLRAQGDFIQAHRRALALQGGPDSTAAVGLLAAARQRLMLVGGTEEGVRALSDGEAPRELLSVPAALTGVVLEMFAQPGIAVERGTPLFLVGNLDSVHVLAQLPEQALSAVSPGMAARIEVRAFPGRILSGRVLRVREQLDPTTRTAPLVVAVGNADGPLKAGMFATVHLDGAALGDSVRVQAYLPEDAVLTDGEDHFVFVQIDEVTFERRGGEVLVPLPGVTDVDPVGIVSGLADGERVVVSGATTLRSELAKASLVDPD